MKHQGGSGTYGGMLERPATTEEAEKREPLNLRSPDLLNDVLAGVLNRRPGGYQTNKTFIIEHEFSRPTDITYDRFYYELNLLVHFFANTKKEYTDHDSVQKEVDDMRVFAHEHGHRFLPIVGGTVLPQELHEALLHQGIEAVT